jgi:hypothetical protein
MTTVVFKEKIKWIADSYETAVDFLNIFDTNTIYDEYLERKMQEVKKSPDSDFVNL